MSVQDQPGVALGIARGDIVSAEAADNPESPEWRAFVARSQDPTKRRLKYKEGDRLVLTSKEGGAKVSISVTVQEAAQNEVTKKGEYKLLDCDGKEVIKDGNKWFGEKALEREL